MGKQDDGRVSLWMLLPMLFCCIWIGCWVFPALGFDGTVAPNGDAGGDESVIFWDPNDSDASCASGNTCDGSDCYTYLDDDPSSPDGTYVTHQEGSNQELILDMGSPTCTGNISTATDAQEIRINFSECDPGDCDKEQAGGEPLAWVYWYCDVSGTPTIQNGGSPILNYTPGGGQVDVEMYDNWTFTPGTDCEADGSDVQFSVFLVDDGKSINERIGCYENLEWNYTCAAEGRRIFNVGEVDGMNPGPPGRKTK